MVKVSVPLPTLVTLPSDITPSKVELVLPLPTVSPQLLISMEPEPVSSLMLMTPPFPNMFEEASISTLEL